MVGAQEQSIQDEARHEQLLIEGTMHVRIDDGEADLWSFSLLTHRLNST